MVRFFSTCLALLLVSLSATYCWAHSFDPERFIIIDSSKDEIEVLIIFREAPGKRLDYLLGIYDRNKDGVFSKKESLAVAPALKKIALSGLEISTPLKGEKTRVKYKVKDGLSIALFYRLPKTVNTLTFQFSNNKNQIMTSVRFVGSALSLINATGPTKRTIILSSGRFGVIRK